MSRQTAATASPSYSSPPAQMARTNRRLMFAGVTLRSASNNGSASARLLIPTNRTASSYIARITFPGSINVTATIRFPHDADHFTLTAYAFWALAAGLNFSPIRGPVAPFFAVDSAHDLRLTETMMDRDEGRDTSCKVVHDTRISAAVWGAAYAAAFARTLQV